MAPYYETKIDRKKRTSETIRRLKQGDQVLLYGDERNPVGVKVSIVNDEQARVEIWQKELLVATGDLDNDGVTISFRESIVPETVSRVVTRQSICAHGLKAGKREVIWRK